MLSSAAKIMGMYSRSWALAVGSDADIVVLDASLDPKIMGTSSMAVRLLRAACGGNARPGYLIRRSGAYRAA